MLDAQRYTWFVPNPAVITVNGLYKNYTRWTHSVDKTLNFEEEVKKTSFYVAVYFFSYFLIIYWSCSRILRNIFLTKLENLHDIFVSVLSV